MGRISKFIPVFAALGTFFLSQCMYKAEGLSLLSATLSGLLAGLVVWRRKKVILTVLLALAFLSVALMYYTAEPLIERGGTSVEIRAEAIGNENVKLLITWAAWDFATLELPPPPDDIRIFATIDNGENVLVEMAWKGPIEAKVGKYEGRRLDGEGTYRYGKDPRGKEIYVTIYVAWYKENEYVEYLRHKVTIS